MTDVPGDDAPTVPVDPDALAQLSPAGRRAVVDRFLVEAPVLVRDALAAAAAADDDGLLRAADTLAEESGGLGLRELEAAASALARAARARSGDVGQPLVAVALAWDAARAALMRSPGAEA